MNLIAADIANAQIEMSIHTNIMGMWGSQAHLVPGSPLPGVSITNNLTKGYSPRGSHETKPQINFLAI
jgi:hypothetical protein